MCILSLVAKRTKSAAKDNVQYLAKISKIR